MTSKGTKIAAEQPNQECCMCGDCGFYDQLLQCRICQFRYQHIYCSNLYPKAKSYETCNMCLIQKVHIEENSPNSSNPSSSSYINNIGSINDEESKNRGIRSGGGDQNIRCKKGLMRGSALQLRQPEKPIRKQRLSEAISPSTWISTHSHKNIVTGKAFEERVKRAKSIDMMNRNGVKKQILRNKVRRYKLLDEITG